MYTYLYESSPIGPLQIVSNGTHIVRIAFGESSEDGSAKESSTDKADKQAVKELCLCCAKQLKEYFAGTRRQFQLPLAPDGTPFQKAVWEAMTRIPYGCVTTYGELAHLAGHPGAARAVGSACRNNPLPIVIPCHRVVAAGGPGGYSGANGLSTKKILLSLEGVSLPS